MQMYPCIYVFGETAQCELCQRAEESTWWPEEHLERPGKHQDQIHVNIPPLEGIVF